MTSFAPGTPKKQIRRVEKQLNKAQKKGFSGEQPRQQLAAPPKTVPGYKEGIAGQNMASSGPKTLPGKPSNKMIRSGMATQKAGLGSVSPTPGSGPANTPDFAKNYLDGIKKNGPGPQKEAMNSMLGGMGAALGKKMGMKKGGSVGSASKRADGIATKGKTKGKMI
jgi:hypothetical protein